MGWKNVAIGGKKHNYRGTYSRVFINATIGPNIWFFCSRIFNKFFFSYFLLPKYIPAQNETCNSCQYLTDATNWNQQNKLPMLNNSQPIANKQNKFIAKRLT